MKRQREFIVDPKIAQYVARPLNLNCKDISKRFMKAKGQLNSVPFVGKNLGVVDI